MPRARAPSEAAEIRERLAALRRETPEWESWVGLLEAALAELDGAGVWGAAVPRAPASRPVGAPCLHETEITLDGRVARRWVGRLLRLARERQDEATASLGRLESRHIDALALIEAAVRQQDARVDELAAASGADAHALRVVAQMAAMPLLQAAGRALEGDVSQAWWEGYCPICGAWPVLAEYRGLERKRWLRCGRCGTGWEVPWLRCPFCDERNHERLGYLTPEDDKQPRKIEVCQSCKGYVKSATVVRPAARWSVLFDDLATVHLDLAAMERGYERPARPGYPLAVRVADSRRGLLRLPFGHRHGRAAGPRRAGAGEDGGG